MHRHLFTEKGWDIREKTIKKVDLKRLHVFTLDRGVCKLILWGGGGLAAEKMKVQRKKYKMGILKGKGENCTKNGLKRLNMHLFRF